jgi:sucrose synthase
VPFREYNPKVTQNWIPKSEVLPYLEGFAVDAERDLLAQMGKAPDLIIGNYSDGNLVAYLLARKLKVTHCCIAHSLEKSRYLFGDLYWQDLEEQYHFSAQFTADLISMNAADFIVTSSYQEIVGTPDTFGQYESYKCFTMPQLYHVVDGIDLFSPKFNRIPPGVNQQLFFPYRQMGDRNATDSDRIAQLLFHQSDERIVGQLDDPNKRALYTASQVDLVKNLSGLIECYGMHPELQDACNLILLTTKLFPEEGANLEEVQQIEKLHQLIEQYHLHGKVRWVGIRLSSQDLGEAYRVIADHQGIFVDFARFESFGQSTLEAMVSGLPTFATQFGGTAEIIDDGDNGFLIDPTDLTGTAQRIIKFVEQCDIDLQDWQTISDRAIRKIQDHYTWEFHTQRLVLLAKVYSFWGFVNHDHREALLRYLDTLFHLIYKPRAEQILEQHMQRI